MNTIMSSSCEYFILNSETKKVLSCSINACASLPKCLYKSLTVNLKTMLRAEQVSMGSTSDHLGLAWASWRIRNRKFRKCVKLVCVKLSCHKFACISIRHYAAFTLLSHIRFSCISSAYKFCLSNRAKKHSPQICA